MELYHNSRKREYRSPYGAVATGTTVTIALDVAEENPGRVYLRLWTGKETLIPMTREADGRYRAQLTMPETPGLVWY